MSSSFFLAVPSNTPGGLDAEISEHFGHCDLFTLIKIQEGKVASVDTVANVEHGAGGCMEPVQLLKDQGVQAIVVGGMGARPMQAFAEVNIDVYYAAKDSLKNVQEAVNGLVQGDFPVMRAEQTCKGAGTCHQ
ncbi:NifB/NifX family molybdenum-iron cluster-binding protein [Desulfobulbus sp. US1]|nr:NifB/NifX family molybdenum-iron cluster-binding protein [Desulfobulbus sp. US4]MCW5204974.1 NifB/NifX family molybdenum-iron cluster-binding protein [Desulfobulbus sp. N2]MCW5209594.1 NifB/NifX family molybdenum-iron cluster-binding protein [Desulfobulbus sp. US1]MCW5210714.1 NifB/NifX family molybdenum-iron cluster-binding protein [Desulfobulbus sp. N3]MCW5214649.1 NifB/NifX family molybdenum-iron cluster-binding protein [Desulfobulbus sp. US5]